MAERRLASDSEKVEEIAPDKAPEINAILSAGRLSRERPTRN